VYSQVDDQNMSEYLMPIGTGLSYPIPFHEHEARSSYGLPRCFLPQSERYASQSLALPMFAALMDDEVDYVIGSVEPFFLSPD
jgi:dTDP-4-amino-4,6-dideoxygalactose transaminase